MRRALLVFAILCLSLTVLAYCRVRATPQASSYPAASLSLAPDLIARGQYLVTAADCMPCHTGPGQAPFSGGLVLHTKFGSISSPNITPDKTTGIGTWTDQQFYAALHEGIAPGQSWGIFPHYLYPAMPYTSYTKLSYPDVMAMKAYLDSLKPVFAPRRPDQLAFPFNQRPTLWAWRLLFFRPGPMKTNPSWDESLKNGAYLTVALGHCGECHTPRNFLQATMPNRTLAGAPLEGLFAPNISSDPRYGVGGWSQTDLVTYLHEGFSPMGGSAYGPMRTVIENATSHLPLTDLEDMAAYLLHGTPPQVTPPAPEVANAVSSIARGDKLYSAHCGICHGGNGAGFPPTIPNLAGNRSVTAALPDNVIGAVLAGLKGQSLKMPAFGNQLNDQQIADITNYVRTAWGNKSMADTTAAHVAELRQQHQKEAPQSAWQMMMGRTLCPHHGTNGSNF